jgi:arylesterase/paraoxonase
MIIIKTNQLIQGVFISATEKTGWLNYYQYADGASQGTIRPLDIKGLSDAKKATFHPLGINFWPETRTLYVINHGEHPAPIEVFTLSEDATTMTYERSITHNLLSTPNAVQPVSDHELYVSNDHHYEVRDQPVLAKLETFLHIAKGSVVYLNLKTNEGKRVAELPFANGIAQLNNTHLAVASTTGLAVHIYEIQPGHSLIQTKRLVVDFWADNLRTDSEGKLLITGHPYAILLERVAKNQHKYNLDHGRRDGLDPSQRPKAGSRVAEWDGNAEGTVRTLYLDNTGEEYGVSTTTVRDARRGIGFVVGLYEKGILQFKP